MRHIDGEPTLTHDKLQDAVQGAEHLACRRYRHSSSAHVVAEVADRACRQSRQRCLADAVGAAKDMVVDVPTISGEAMPGHALAPLLSALAVLQEREAGVSQPHLVRVRPEGVGVQLS